MTVASKKNDTRYAAFQTHAPTVQERLSPFVFTLCIYLFCSYANRKKTWQLHFMNIERDPTLLSYQGLGDLSNVVTEILVLWFFFQLIDSDFNSYLQPSLLSFWQCLVNLTTNPLTPGSLPAKSSLPSCLNRIVSKRDRNCPRLFTTTGIISWSSKTDV